MVACVARRGDSINSKSIAEAFVLYARGLTGPRANVANASSPVDASDRSSIMIVNARKIDRPNNDRRTEQRHHIDMIQIEVFRPQTVHWCVAYAALWYADWGAVTRDADGIIRL